MIKFTTSKKFIFFLSYYLLIKLPDSNVLLTFESNSFCIYSISLIMKFNLPHIYLLLLKFPYLFQLT